MRKGQFLLHAMKDKTKDPTVKLLNQLKHPLQPKLVVFFSAEKFFYQHLMVNLQNNHLLSSSPQDERIVMKTKHPVHIILFGVATSISYIMPPFILPCASDGNLHQVHGRGSAVQDQESGCWKTQHLATGLCSMSHKQEDPVLAIRKFLPPHHP